jgi:hypothetical protein
VKQNKLNGGNANMKDVKVGEVYQVNILKYWFRGKVVKVEGDRATLSVPTYYGREAVTVTSNVNDLREVEVDLTKKDNKYRK